MSVVVRINCCGMLDVMSADVLKAVLCFARNIMQIQKKKIWESVQPHLKTDDSCIAMLGEQFMQTCAGVVMCRSLKNANIG